MYIYAYYMHYAEGVLTLKSVVAAIWVLDTLHVVFDSQLWRTDKFGVYCLASDLINVLVIFVVQRQVTVCYTLTITDRVLLASLRIKSTTTFLMAFSLSLSSEAVGDHRNRIGMGKLISVHRFTDRKTSILAQIRFYCVVPAVAIIALAEANITLRGFVRQALWLCTPKLLVAIAALVTAVGTQDTWLLGLSFVIGKSSLNSREYLRSGTQASDALGVTVIGIAIDPAPVPTKGIPHIPIRTGHNLMAGWRACRQAVNMFGTGDRAKYVILKSSAIFLYSSSGGHIKRSALKGHLGLKDVRGVVSHHGSTIGYAEWVGRGASCLMVDWACAGLYTPTRNTKSDRPLTRSEHKEKKVPSSFLDSHALQLCTGSCRSHVPQRVCQQVRASYRHDMGIPGGFGKDLSWENTIMSAHLFAGRSNWNVQSGALLTGYINDASTKKLLVTAVWILDMLHVSLSIASGELIFDLYSSIVLCSYNTPSLSPSSEVAGDCPSSKISSGDAVAIDGISTSSLWLANDEAGVFTHIRIVVLTDTLFYGATTAMAAVPLAEVLITVSLCVLFHDSGSASAFPRTERLLSTHHLYCQPVFVDFVSLTLSGLNFIIGKLYANSLLASPNARKHLRSQSSGTESLAVERIDTVHFTNLPRLSGDEESSKDGATPFDMHGIAVVDIGAVATLDKVVTLRKDGAFVRHKLNTICQEGLEILPAYKILLLPCDQTTEGSSSAAQHSPGVRRYLRAEIGVPFLIRDIVAIASIDRC
ncbi:hypothetical protein EDD17DRAFT_1512807 [Pisolithus thermaeus]|nr:hypothetical protein EDD17DRAFT_1512807 [Pisolithus thermaeus]